MRPSWQLHDLTDSVFGKPLTLHLRTPDDPDKVVSRAPGISRVALDLPVRPIHPDPDVAADPLQLGVHLRALTVGKVAGLEHCTPGRHVTPPYATRATGRSWPRTGLGDPSAARVVASSCFTGARLLSLSSMGSCAGTSRGVVCAICEVAWA